MTEAIRQLRSQGLSITPDEAEAAQIAILLHDIGHCPFSHALENSLLHHVHHEQISLALMQHINHTYDGKLNRAIAIFRNAYPKHFLHQLVSGQLDMDRLDYLCRDSFFTGVNEGTVASARIIKMLNVKHDQLVVDAKGVYSIEKFLVARRLMYWQVYLHKTSVAAECMLTNILKRAKQLIQQGTPLTVPEALLPFLQRNITIEEFKNNSEITEQFVSLDDNDVWVSLKTWRKHPDPVISTLSSHFIDRKLFKVKTQSTEISGEQQCELTHKYATHFGISHADARYFWGVNTVSTDTYSPQDDRINILYKDGEVLDISEASDMLNLQVLTRKVDKHFLSYYQLT